MATRYLAAGSTDINSTASWRATIDGATGAAVPVADDEVLITEGTQAVTTNLSQLASVDLQSVLVTPTSFVSTPAGSGLSLQVSNATTATPQLDYQGSGSLFTIVSSGASGIDTIIARPSAGTLVISGSAAIGTVVAVRGRVVIDGAASPTTVYNLGAELIVEDGSAITTVYQSGGNTVCRRDITTANAHAGTLRAYDAVDITTLNLEGGNVQYASAGTVTTLNAYRGLFSIDGAEQAGAITTLNLNATSNVARVVKSVGGLTATIGTLNSLTGDEAVSSDVPLFPG